MSSVITFNDEYDSFSFLVSAELDHKAIAELLRDTCHDFSVKVAGEFAAEFAKLCRVRYAGGRLITGLSKVLTVTKWYYVVTLPAKLTTPLQVTIREIRSGYASNIVFTGTLKEFSNWSSGDKYKENVGKVVKFVYKGGSGTRQRIVKLTSVTGSGAGTLLKGWDVNKSTAEKTAYRTYRVGNIVGNVEVVS